MAEDTPKQQKVDQPSSDAGRTTSKPELVFYIAVDRDVPGSANPQASTDKFVEATVGRLEKMGEVIAVASKWLADKVSKIDNRPDSFSMEFGIDVGGEAGVPFITKGTIEANFKVTIGWGSSK
jgi:hypothetical protein